MTVDPNDEIILPLREYDTLNGNTKKERIKAQLDIGFIENFNNMKKDPDSYVESTDDQLLLIMCKECNAPQILHKTMPGEACKLVPLPSAVCHALNMNVERSDSYKLAKSTADKAARKKDEQGSIKSENPSHATHHGNKVKVPVYTSDNFDHWCTTIRAWDQTYIHLKPLEKYLDLIHALDKGTGEKLSQKLQGEGLNFNSDTIIEDCLKKLEGYLEKTELLKLGDINTLYRDISRGLDESMSDYVSRYRTVITKQKEAGMKICEKTYTIDVYQKANLDANAKNIVAAQINFNAEGCLETMFRALVNVTPNASGTFFNERARSRTRGNYNRFNRSRSNTNTRHRDRCPCSLCAAHDRDWEAEKMNRSKGGYKSYDNKSDGKERSYIENAAGNFSDNSSDEDVSETYCLNSAYLNSFDKQVIIDTGCVPSLMSSQDVPYLESLIGRKLKPTGHWLKVRFGDGPTSKTEAVIRVPFWDGKKIIEIDVGVVKDRIPFLLGMSFLRNVSQNLIFDDKVELKGGAVHRIVGDGRGHMKLDWSKSLHCKDDKVGDPNFIHVSHYVEPSYNDFFDDDGQIAFKANVTVNSKDLLMDTESTRFLEKVNVISRKGTYDEKETDRVYLFRTNQIKKFDVISPYEYSEIENSIMLDTHDRGIRDGIDLDEEMEEIREEYEKEREKVEKKVRFQETASMKVYSKFETTWQFVSNDFVNVNDSQTSFYSNMTRKCVDITHNDETPDDKRSPSGTFFSSIKPANRPAPIECAFEIRTSGQIININDEVKFEGSNNLNFQSFIFSYYSPETFSSDEESLKRLSEEMPEKVLSFAESIVPKVEVKVDVKESYSQKQMHDAHKRKPPKKKAVRGNKKESQNLKPNVEIPGIKEAMDLEIEKFIKYDVFEEVSDSPYIYKIPSNWVITKKDEKKEGSETFKARLVALGNLDRKINLSATDSPTLGRESMRLLLSTIANMEFRLQGCDVSSAFLQGTPLTRDVFMLPPPQYRKPGKIWKLKKPVYGLADSGRLWYQRLREEILRLGCTELTGDGAAFLMHKNGELVGIIGAHVDDLIYGGTSEFEEQVMAPLMKTFNISKTDYETFVFCGMTLRQNSDKSITVSQREYSQTIEDLPDYSKMNETEKVTLLKSVAGQCLYLNLTRPDLMFDSSEILRVGKTTDERLKMAEKLLKKVKNGTGNIIFRKLGPLDDLEVRVYSDASFNNIKYGKMSTAGSVILLKGCESGYCAPIHWMSKPITRVTRSTMAAEARALEIAIDYAVLYSRQLKEIYTGVRTIHGIKVTAITDSQTLLDAIVSSRQVEDKTLVHLIYGIKDKLMHNEVYRVSWTCTLNMLADGLTKSGVQMGKLMNMIETGVFPKNLNY